MLASMTSYKTTRPINGEFQIKTRRNSYYVRLKYEGLITDCAPPIKGFMYCFIDELLAAVNKKEGRYEVRKIVRQ